MFLSRIILPIGLSSSPKRFDWTVVPITHTRAAAFVGAGARKRRHVDLRIVLQIFGAWLLTFPICALLGFLLTLGLLVPFG